MVGPLTTQAAVPRRGHAVGSLLLAFCTLALASSARADKGNPTAARLADEAKQLLDQGKPDLACPKLAESVRLEPSLGARMSLAHCYELDGKTASAWAQYKQAAHMDGSTEQINLAAARVAALEPHLAHATLAGATIPGLRLTLDGKPLTAGLGTSFAIDSGDHDLEASAPGKQPRTVHFHVEPMASARVALPALEAATEAVPTPEAETAHGTVVSHSQRLAGWVTVGAGAAVVAAGAAFGVVTLVLGGEVAAACPGGPCFTQADLDKNATAYTFALLSDIFIPVGVVAAGIGAYLVVSATHPAKVDTGAIAVTPLVGSRGGGLAVVGRF